VAGSYYHAVNERTGMLRNPRHMMIAAENLGDAYETIREMYAMIWYLAEGNEARVKAAEQRIQAGLDMSPGEEPRTLRYDHEVSSVREFD
jgi:hypothetical protein